MDSFILPRRAVKSWTLGVGDLLLIVASQANIHTLDNRFADSPFKRVNAAERRVFGSDVRRSDGDPAQSYNPLYCAVLMS